MIDESPKGLGCVFLFVFLPIIILGIVIKGIIYLILFWLESGSVMDRNKKITNIIGVIVLGTIIVGVTIQRSVQYFQDQNDREVTKRMADDLAHSLINDSSNAVVMEWARGEYLDAWDNQFIIDYNNRKKGVCVRSRGPDGESHTEDDILSHEIYESDGYLVKTLSGDEVQDRLSKIKERLESVKRSSENEKWGFNFEWKVRKNETR